MGEREIVLAGLITLANPPRPGLVPQSGDWDNPVRWVRPEDAAQAQQQTPQQQVPQEKPQQQPVDPNDVNQQVESYIEKHKKIFSEVTKSLDSLFPDVKIESRMKTTAIAIGKIAKKGTMEGMTDIAGFRLNIDSLDELEDIKSKIRENFKITREENYFETPKDYYRAQHFIVSDGETSAEIQIHTPQTAKLSQWSHDSIYKLANTVDTSSLEEILGYARNMSDHYYGLLGDVPCPEVVEVNVGCLEN